MAEVWVDPAQQVAEMTRNTGRFITSITPPARHHKPFLSQFNGFVLMDYYNDAQGASQSYVTSGSPYPASFIC
jgi:hypothetical protein